MSSSSFARGERAPLTFKQIKKRLADSKHSQDAIFSIYQILLADGFQFEDDDSPAAAELKRAVDAIKRSYDLKTLLAEITLHESAAPGDKIELIKSFLLGQGSLTKRILQILSQLAKAELDLDERLLAKKEIEEWEENKKLLLTYIYSYGDENDRQFLQENFAYYSYFHMLEDLAKTGGEWVGAKLAAILSAPAELTNLYNAWKMSRNLQGNALEKAKYKALNHLANARHPQKYRSSSIEPIPDEFFAKPEFRKGKEKLTTPSASVGQAPRENTFFNYELSQQGQVQLQESLSASQIFNPDSSTVVTVEKEKEKETEQQLNVSMTNSFIWLEKPAPAASLLELEEQLAKLASDDKAVKLCTFNANNLRVLAQNCRRIDDAKKHEYYSAEEVQVITTASKLNAERDRAPDSLRQIMAGAHVKIRHSRYASEIAQLNDTEKNPFTVLRKIQIADEEIIRKIDQIEQQWQRRSGFASVSSASLLQLTQNVETLFVYIENAKEEIKNDNTLNQGDWLETINILQALEQLANQTREEIIGAMLERLKLVPAQDLAAIDSFEDDNKAYFDDLVFDTMNSLVPCGLPEKYVVQFAQQTHPTQSLTVGVIKAFRRYIVAHGASTLLESLIKHDGDTEVVLKEDDNSLIIATCSEYEPRSISIPKTQGVLIPKSIKAKLTEEDKEKEKIEETEPKKSAPSLMQSSGWFDMESVTTLHFPNEDVVELEQTEIGEFYDLMPGDKAIADEDYVYMFNSDQDEKALALAMRYFSKKTNQQYFIQVMKDYLLHHPESNIDDQKCLEFAFEQTALFLINQDAAMFDRPSLQLAKAKFTEIAEEKATQWFNGEHDNEKFEECVLDDTFDGIVQVENEINLIHRQLVSCKRSSEELAELKELFTKTAYSYLFENCGAVDAVNQAIKKAHQELLIETNARLIHNNCQDEYKDDYKARFTRIAKQCVVQGVNTDAAIVIAKKSINLLHVLREEEKRVQTHTKCMRSARTREKLAGFAGKIAMIDAIDSSASFDGFKASLLLEETLCAKRGWFGLFQSTTEKNLHKFITNQSPERNLIKIRP